MIKYLPLPDTTFHVCNFSFNLKETNKARDRTGIGVLFSAGITTMTLKCTVFSSCGRYLVSFRCPDLAQGPAYLEVYFNTVDPGNPMRSPSASSQSSSAPPTYFHTAEVRTQMVTEITKQAGLEQNFSSFVKMMYSALTSGSSPSGNAAASTVGNSLKFFVETYQEMTRRVLEELSNKVGVAEDFGLLGQPSNSNSLNTSMAEPHANTPRFLTIDYRAEFVQAIFPIPLVAREWREHPSQQGYGPAAGNSSPYSWSPMATESTLSTPTHLTHSLQGTPANRHEVTAIYAQPKHHGGPIGQLDYTPSPHSRGSPTTTTAAASPMAPQHLVVNAPPPPLQAPVQATYVDPSIAANNQHLRSFIATLEAENKKLKRENDALSKLTKEKMQLMQQECTDVQRKVVKDHEDLRHFKSEALRLSKDLARAKSDVEGLRTQLSSAHAKIRSMGGSPSVYKRSGTPTGHTQPSMPYQHQQQYRTGSSSGLERNRSAYNSQNTSLQSRGSSSKGAAHTSTRRPATDRADKQAYPRYHGDEGQKGTKSKPRKSDRFATPPSRDDRGGLYPRSSSADSRGSARGARTVPAAAYSSRVSGGRRFDTPPRGSHYDPRPVQKSDSRSSSASRHSANHHEGGHGPDNYYQRRTKEGRSSRPNSRDRSPDVRSHTSNERAFRTESPYRPPFK